MTRTYMIPVAEKLPVGEGSKVLYVSRRSDYPARIYYKHTGTVVHISDIGHGPIFYIRFDGKSRPSRGYHVTASTDEILAVREEGKP